MRNFFDLMRALWGQGKFACVGLDSEYENIPESARKETICDTILHFNLQIIDATKDFVCAYKPNIAFYEAYGSQGLLALRQTIDYIYRFVPWIPVILDAKRADIGNTNNGYAKAVFSEYGADAVTINPYFGAKALQPFLSRADKGIIIICRTSNPGAGEFQDLPVKISDSGEWIPLYQYIAHNVAEEWNVNKNCAVVVGATYPEELAKVRSIIGDMTILIPGIGKQGGDVEKVVEAGKNSLGQGMIINSSSGIIFASNGPDFAEAARRETIKLHEEIQKYL